MRLIWSLGLLLLFAAVALLTVALVARFSDGPIGPLAGGPFQRGEVSSGPDINWNSLALVPQVELQLVNPPRSRTTHFLVYEGHAYIPCGIVKMGPFVFVGQSFWKQWHHEVRKDPRVVLRSNGTLYELRAIKVTDPVLHRRLSELLSAKYHLDLQGPPDPQRAWFYRLEPREG